MPKAAVEIGAAEEILPLAEIAEAIARLVPTSDITRSVEVTKPVNSLNADSRYD